MPTPDVNKTDPGLLADIMRVDADAAPAWNADDLAAMLEHQLSAPIEADLADAARHSGSIFPQAAADAPMPRTFRELFQRTNPPLAALRMVAQFAEARRTDRRSPLPEEIVSVLRLASILLARVRCQARISDQSDAEIRRGAEWVIAQPWVDEATRQLLRTLADSMPPNPAELKPEAIQGVILGDFLVGPPVGEGGFATVHVGRQLSTGRKVAVKILHDGTPPEHVARFQKEAAYLARFNHPNIVSVLGFGQEAWKAPADGPAPAEPWLARFRQSAPVKAFIAMEWVEGRTLEEVYRAGREAVGKGDRTLSPEWPEGCFAQKGPVPFSGRTLAEWFAQAAGAMAVVHATGLIHRDIKPSNVMVSSDGVVKLMDFGIARSRDESRTIVTATGGVCGTLAYMSPEQVRAADSESLIGPASDIYSLCATFYELFTLTRLLQHDTQSPAALQNLKLHGASPRRPGALAPGLPWEIETILMGGLEGEVPDRYRSMDALEQDIRRFLANQPIQYKRPTLARRLSLGYRRHRTVTHLVAIFLLAAVIGTALYIGSIRREQARTLAQQQLAERNAQESRERLAASYEEQGRQEYLAGSSLRAAAYLSEAYSMGRDTPSLRFLLARAAGDIPDRSIRSEGHTRGVYGARYSADATKVVTAGRDGLVKVWDAATGRVLRTFELAPGVEVTGAVFSPDGTRVLAAGGGAHAAVWDVATGRRLFDLVGHQGQRTIHTPGFSPDGARIVTACDDGTACVWDATDGHRLHTLTGKGPVLCAFFSPDGSKIVTASESFSAAIWDAGSGALLHELVDAKTVTWAAFSADGGKVLVTGNHAWFPVAVWDTATGKKIESFGPAADTVPHALFNPSGEKIVVWGRNATAKLWDSHYEVTDPDHPAQPGRGVAILNHGGEVLAAEFSHDGRVLATGGRDGTVTLYDGQTGAFLRQLTGHRGPVYEVTFSPDDTGVLSSAEDGTARFCEAKSGNPLLTLDGRPEGAPTNAGPLVRTIPRYAPVRFASFSADGQSIICGGIQAAVFDTKTGQSVTGGMFPGSKMACLGLGDCLFVTVEKDSVLTIYAPFTGQNWKLNFAALGSPSLNSAAFSSDGTRIIVTGTGAAWILDTRALAKLDRDKWMLPVTALGNLLTLPHSAGREEVVQAQFSPDGQLALTAGADGVVRLWDPATGAPKAILRHAGAVNTATFSPDGRSILTASDDATAVLWDMATGQRIHTFKGHNDYVRMAAFCADGQRIVTAGRDGSAKVWDTGSGRQVASLDGHEGPLTCADFSPDGALVVTSAEDGRAIVWDSATGKELAVLRGHTSDVYCAQFSPDGSLIVTGGEDATLRLWDSHLETRSPVEISDLVRRRVPWIIAAGRLEPVQLPADPSTRPTSATTPSVP